MMMMEINAEIIFIFTVNSVTSVINGMKNWPSPFNHAFASSDKGTRKINNICMVL